MVTSTTKGAAFLAGIRAKAKKVEVNVAEITINATLTMYRSLQHNTPIVTGQARANWQAELNGQNSNVLVAGVRPPATVAWESYGSDAEAIIRSYKSGDKLNVFNNSPYIRDLNDGSSKQSAGGFIEAATAEFFNVLRASNVTGG